MNNVRKLDKALDYVQTLDITELNDTILVCIAIVSEKYVGRALFRKR